MAAPRPVGAQGGWRRRHGYNPEVTTRLPGGQFQGIRIPTLFDENNAIRCEACGGPIEGTPFRISLMDVVAREAPPTWAVAVGLNPGPHQFHADPTHFRAWCRRRGYLFCRLSDVRELMRPVPIPGERARWGVCDGMHREAHEFVPA